VVIVIAVKVIHLFYATCQKRRLKKGEIPLTLLKFPASRHFFGNFLKGNKRAATKDNQTQTTGKK
jgi:hypothetical protein